MRYGLPAIALSLFCAFPAVALDLPARKAGLWELKMTGESAQMPPQVMQQCIDAATDKTMNEKFSGAQGMCSKQELRKSGNTIVAEASCKSGDMATTTQSVFDGDFDSAYTVKIATTIEGGAARPSLSGKTNMTIEAKWLGPCKAGQKPGDIEMPNGMKMNILDLPKTPTPPQR
jgi:hypothetical protein